MFHRLFSFCCLAKQTSTHAQSVHLFFFFFLLLYLENRDLDKNEIAYIEDGTFAKVNRFGRL